MTSMKLLDIRTVIILMTAWMVRLFIRRRHFVINLLTMPVFLQTDGNYLWI